MNKNFRFSLLIFLSFNFFFVNKVISQPAGTPSSSYNNDYNLKNRNQSEFQNEIKSFEPILTNNIVVKGNKRLESTLIISESKIQEIGFDEKSLEIWIERQESH